MSGCHRADRGYPESFTGPTGEQAKLRAIRDEVVTDAAPGVLNRSHRFHLEARCRLVVNVRGGYAKTGDFANVNKFLTQMGMNPAAQSTVRGTKNDDGKKTSAFGQLASTQLHETSGLPVIRQEGTGYREGSSIRTACAGFARRK